jgi:hypothetical protein
MGMPKAASPRSAIRLARVAVAAGAVLAVVPSTVPAASAPSHQSRFPGTNGNDYDVDWGVAP